MVKSNAQSPTQICGRVVIIEDDPLLNDLLIKIFTDLGADCIAFTNGEDALMHMIQAKVSFTLLVTDYSLPGQLNGDDIAHMVHKRWPMLPIILSSGFGSDVSKGLPSNVSFLCKPWTLELMIRTAQHLVGK